MIYEERYLLLTNFDKWFNMALILQILSTNSINFAKNAFTKIENS